MPIAQTSVIAVIPCLNEERTIEPLVREILEHLPAVLVIDDGSTDQTSRQAAAGGALVVRRPGPAGKGAALTAGFSRARELGFDWALALDGDGQHAPADIPGLLECAQATGARMVVGNRMAGARAMPAVRRQVNRWMSARLSRYCGQRLPDSQCGFRLLDLRCWSRFSYAAQHFEIESELLVRFSKAGLPVAFAPVQTRYGREISKIHPVRDTLRWWRWWRAIRRELRAAAPLLPDAPSLPARPALTAP